MPEQNPTSLIKILCAALLFVFAFRAEPSTTSHHGTAPKHGKQWPECTPPDSRDPGALSNSVNVNGTQYYCSAEGRWVVDQKAMEWKRNEQRSRDELLAALTRRKLTHAELMRIDSSLNTREMEPYFAAVKYAEMYDLLVTQWEIQTGTILPIKTPLSRALGEYNRTPQEGDNRRAVEKMIDVLRALEKNPIESGP